MDKNELLEIENIEIKLLLDAIYLKYGYDFNNYIKSHVKRRVLNRVALNELDSILQLTSEILYNRNVFDQLLMDLSINVTEMFRFPLFFKEIRKHVIPLLKTYPSITIWHAGCSTGEEVVSMAILLEEEGLLDRSRIYATDINKTVLDIAKTGIYPISEIKNWTKNYQEAGGKNSFSKYYTAKYDSVIMDQNLYKNMVFLEHNLSQDKKFISANLIICRNVLIYFDKTLKEIVLDLFDESLIPGGVLGLGSKENIMLIESILKLDVVSIEAKIFSKKVTSDYGE